MGLPGGVGIFGTTLGSSGGNGAVDPVGAHKSVELSHLYPSPTDLASSFNTTGGINPMVEHNLSGMDLDDSNDADVTGFPDFDWGEHLAGGPGNAGGMRNQDFDDGMLMGLTDDDFSFFDDPAPLPVSMPMTSFPGLQSAGPSPKFVDHFSHLAASTPFASAASPSSPFGHQSPHPQPSPNLPQYHFDSSHSFMGGTPRTVGAHLPLSEASPLKTPRTPYTPIIEGLDEQHNPAEIGLVPFAMPSVSVATTPGGTIMMTRPAQHQAFPSQFDPVPFGVLHAQSDEKYDPRSGKFGLPSPDWERDSRRLHLIPGEDPLKRHKHKSSTAPWYAIVGDPRIAIAKELKRNRTSSLNRRGDKEADAVLNRDAYSRRGCTRQRFSKALERAGAVVVDSEYGDLNSDDDSESLDRMQDDELAMDRRGSLFSDDDAASPATSHRGVGVKSTFGAALLLLRQHVSTIFAHREATSGPIPAPTKAMMAADGQTENALAMIGDQIMFNPDFRGRPLLAFDSVKNMAPRTGECPRCVENQLRRADLLGYFSPFASHPARQQLS
jgi:hypothetical protein